MLTVHWTVHKTVISRCQAARFLARKLLHASQLDCTTDHHIAARRCPGILALLVDIKALAQLVSIGTLFVFFMVAYGVLQRRFYVPGSGDIWPLLSRVLAMVVFTIGAHSLSLHI